MVIKIIIKLLRIDLSIFDLVRPCGVLTHHFFYRTELGPSNTCPKN
jgi:hypothetical protein